MFRVYVSRDYSVRVAELYVCSACVSTDYSAHAAEL